MNIATRIRKIEAEISNKLDRKLDIWPILGGFSTHLPGEEISKLMRSITPEEGELARAKQLPCPILITLSKEQEFLEYLKNEINYKIKNY